MPVRTIDATGLRCPQPVLRLTLLTAEMGHGDIVEVTADCPTFETDVRAWCTRLRKTLLSVRNLEGYRKIIQIRF